MKLSDYVVDFLAQRGVTHVFGISGGAAVHLFDSAARHPGMQYICGQHEQSSAISADGYARATGKLGVAITTSGPGATNLLTGVCCSYYDSVPTLMITGQVATHRLKGDRPVRQVGFQETDVLSIFGTVTKYAVQIHDPNTIRYHLEKAYHLAFEGRPGSVLIDLPDDLQRADVQHDAMRPFLPEAATLRLQEWEREIAALLRLLREASRPIVVLGGGLTTPRVGMQLEELINALGVPVLMTWAGLDLLPHDHPSRVGPFGVYGPRLGNYCAQNCDLMICLGTRLSQNVTGGVLSSFARDAKIVMVDASQGEMDKFDGRGMDIHLRVLARLDEFLPRLLQHVKGCVLPGNREWLGKIRHWRDALPDDRPGPAAEAAGYVDAYHFVDELSACLPEGETVIVDTGGNLTWTCNGLKVKRGQKLLSAWNNTPMGYSLPAAIGAAPEQISRRVTCVIGDGGLILCLGELATLVRHRLPIKVLLFNNHCHGIQRQTLETWLGGHYVGVDPASGLAFPDFAKVAEAMGLRTFNVNRSSGIAEVLREVYGCEGPVFCNVEINPDQKLYPVLKFGQPLENQMPPLDPGVIASEMLIPVFHPQTDALASKASAGV